MTDKPSPYDIPAVRKAVARIKATVNETRSFGINIEHNGTRITSERDVRRLIEERDALAAVARRFIEESGIERENPTSLDDDFANVAQAIITEHGNYKHERDALAVAITQLQHLNQCATGDDCETCKGISQHALLNGNVQEILDAHDAEVRKAGAVKALQDVLAYSYDPDPGYSSGTTIIDSCVVEDAIAQIKRKEVTLHDND